MNHWIGVIGSKIASERFFNGTDSWFCMPKSCEIGDYVLMYASKKAAGVKGGMIAVYQVVNKDESKDGDCRRYGIFSGSGERPIYVDLKLLDKFQITISFQTIKAHNYLSGFSYVRRNFQATYFKISEKEYKAFIALGAMPIE
jgi:predicted RNA-binding protein with PUA-like domain